MCATDFGPFIVVKGKGFHKAAQHVIVTGHKYRNVSAKVILPSARSISRRVETSAEAKHQDFVEKTALEDHSMFGITTDLWTNDATSTSHVTITLHFIDSNWDLQSVSNISYTSIV